MGRKRYQLKQIIGFSREKQQIFIMKILFFGQIKTTAHSSQNSQFEYLALKKIYKNIDVIDCAQFFLLPSISHRIFYHISPKIFEPFLNNFILSRIKKNYDLIYVTSDSAPILVKN